MTNNDTDFIEIEQQLNDRVANGLLDGTGYQAAAEAAMVARGFVFDRRSGCTCPLDHNPNYGHHFSCGWAER